MLARQAEPVASESVPVHDEHANEDACATKHIAMKRSEINAIMRAADAFIRQHQFYLPPFAYWTPAEWAAKGPEVREIVEHKLGWDITDFGRGDYANYGLFLFTVRNGSLADLRAGTGKVYAEKLMIVGVDQFTPMHFHWNKTEDIINRGGGKLAIQVYNATPDDTLAETDVTVSMDGVEQTVKAGTTLFLTPGESITLRPYCYHTFWGGQGTVLVGEVSTVNDDDADNCFLEPIGRFPDITEDEAPLHLLVNDYPTYYRPGA
jgi:D-lyxose ketol-isomerase